MRLKMGMSRWVRIRKGGEVAKIPPPYPFRYILLMETKAIRGKHSGSQWYGLAFVILSGLGC